MRYRSENRRRETGASALAPADGTFKAALERAKREAVEKVLARADGNVADAASILGILRTSLYRIMRRYGITAPARPRGGSPE